MFVTLRSAAAGQAVARAFTAFAQRHPTYAEALFDEHFLQSRVAPLLRAPGGAAALTPEWLAGAWAAQFGGRAADTEALVEAATPVAADFIELLARVILPDIVARIEVRGREVAA
ncbi:MAG TPA: hypothetical protein PKD53_12250 [Chloroflexaceae bacterium]|nr:hypothetical protein [Chloroflexaceae bacterium]